MFWPIYIRPYFALCTWIRCCNLFIRQWSVTWLFWWAWMQSECCFNLLQGSCPFFFFFFFFFCVDSSVAWIRQARSCHLHLLEDCACGGLLPLRRALLVWPMYFKGHFLRFMASLVTYIRQSEILSLSHFLATYIHLRNFVTQAALVTYIRLNGIYHLAFIAFVPVIRVVSNLHPSRRNLVTLVSYTRWGCRQ